MHTLEIKNLHVEINGTKILKGFSLKINSGETHAIMGPNGSGKSTPCACIMGHPKYEVIEGNIYFDGQDITEMETDERARLGIFLALQYPAEIPGVTFGNFLRTSKNIMNKEENKDSKEMSPSEFMKVLKGKLESAKMDLKFIGRSVNDGFSGGEKKRAEILQMSVLEPKIALLDEIDSGLDVDALRAVSDQINLYRKAEDKPGFLIITHYQRILDYVIPDFVHIMTDGKIIKSGDKNLALEVEKDGYEKFIST